MKLRWCVNEASPELISDASKFLRHARCCYGAAPGGFDGVMQRLPTTLGAAMQRLTAAPDVVDILSSAALGAAMEQWRRLPVLRCSARGRPGAAMEPRSTRRRPGVAMKLGAAKELRRRIRVLRCSTRGRPRSCDVALGVAMERRRSLCPALELAGAAMELRRSVGAALELRRVAMELTGSCRCLVGAPRGLR